MGLDLRPSDPVVALPRPRDVVACDHMPAVAEDGKPDPDAELVLRVHALNQTGRYQAAPELARRASAADPGSARPHSEIAYALHDLGRDDEALSSAELASRLAPDPEVGHRLRSIRPA